MDEEDHSSGPEESETQVPSGLAVSKFLSRSRNSLNVSRPSYCSSVSHQYCGVTLFVGFP